MKQFLSTLNLLYVKRKRNLKYFIQTRRRENNNYEAEKFWNMFYSNGVEGREIGCKDPADYKLLYHYKGIELLILQHLQNNSFSIRGGNVLDVGSGSGWWIDFYRTLLATHIYGIEISSVSYTHLIDKYKNDTNIKIFNNKACDAIESIQEQFDIINAIGVMYHIVDDTEWENTIHLFSQSISNHGFLIVGGNFGLLDGINIPHPKAQGKTNRRLRSLRHWKKILKKYGFKNISLYRNYSSHRIHETPANNHLLIASKERTSRA